MNLIYAFALLMAQIQPSAAVIPTVDEFRQASVAERRAVLRTVFTATDPIGTAVRDLFVVALEDADSDVRDDAFATVAARAYRLRGQPRVASDQDTLETAILIGLRRRLLDLYRNPDEKVRLAAVLAAGNIDLAVSPDRERLSSEFTQSVIALYDGESSVQVRIEIVKALALAASNGPDIGVQALFLNALHNPNPAIAQYGVRGLGRMRNSDALPAIASLLSGGDRGVRMAAAQALSGYGKLAVPYLALLEAAAAQEIDEATRNTMIGAVQRVQAAKQ
jgi:hypothetical protein